MNSRLNTKGEENVFLIEENGAEIGRATLSQDGKYLENVRINEDKRRQGLGSRLYDYIEQQIGNKLEPSPIKQTKEAKVFWEKRKKGAEDAVQVEKSSWRTCTASTRSWQRSGGKSTRSKT